MIRYDISPLDPEAHLYIVGITIDDPTPDEQYLRLPTWIAGSYLIRDFAATLLFSFTASSALDGSELFWEKLLFRLKRSTKLLGA